MNRLKTVYTSAPGKVILFGEHGVNRGKTAIAAAVQQRAYCQFTVNSDNDGYRLISGERSETDSISKLSVFKAEIDALEKANDCDGISRMAGDFFAPLRYVLACLLEYHSWHGIEIEWRSQIPMGGGLGSGAAAATSLVLAFFSASNLPIETAEIAELARKGDVIAHGGVASSLDSSTSAYGGMIQYTVAKGAKPLNNVSDCPLVLIDTLVRANTATINTTVREWLERIPSNKRIFENVGYVVEHALEALELGALEDLGNLMDLHNLLQERMGTGFPESRRDIARAFDAGALGAKITGSGGGGIVIALCRRGSAGEVARLINSHGGVATPSQAGVEGVRFEKAETWKGMSLTDFLDPDADFTFGDSSGKASRQD